MSIPENSGLPPDFYKMTQPELLRIFETIHNDLTRGANELTRICLQQIYQTMQKQPAVDKTSWLELLAALMQCRASMVPLKNVLGQLRKIFLTLPETDFTSHALLAVNGLSHEFRELNQAIACHGAALITDGATVMTISHSSVVTATMANAKQMGKRFRVIQLASAPGNEGYVAASKLDQLHIPTQIITDAQAGLFIPRTDMLMVGCDSWLSDHYFVNKAGTYSLALLAKAHGKPFWVLADHYKNSKQDHTQVTLEEMDSEELDAPEGDFIKARNIYFETVPCELVAGRVDESGSHEL